MTIYFLPSPKARMEEFAVASPRQAFVQIRMGIYESMILAPEILRKYRCPYNVRLLRWARRRGYRTGLATMSHFAYKRKRINGSDLM